MTMPHYDDNFGHWDNWNEDPEGNAEFWQYCTENSVEKQCEGCGRTVCILPHYGYCDSCATKREQGYDI